MRDRDEIAGSPGGGRIPPRAFRSELRDLPPGEFRRFVAALWAARGRTTAVDGRTVVVRRADGSRRRLLVVARPHWWSVPAERGALPVDGVVCASARAPVRALARAAGADVYGSEHLREQLLYAVDADARDRLLSTFFDVAALRNSDAPRDERTPLDGIPEVGDALPVRPALVVVFAAVAAALLVGVVDLPVGADPRSSDASSTAELADRTAPVSVEVTGRTVDRTALAAAERDLAAATPPCSRSPESVVQFHLNALRNDEAPRAGAVAPPDRYVHPDADDAVRRYAAAGAPPNRSAYAPLREFEAVTFDFVRWADGTPSQRVTVRSSGRPAATYRFDLARYDPRVDGVRNAGAGPAQYDLAPDRECWGLVAVERVG